MRKLVERIALGLLLLSSTWMQAQRPAHLSHQKKWTPEKFVELKHELESEQFLDHYYVLVELSTTDYQESNSIQILSPAGNKQFVAAIPVNTDAESLKKRGIRSIGVLSTEQKIAPELQSQNLPLPALAKSSRLPVAVVFQTDFHFDQIEDLMASYDVDITDEAADIHSRSITIEMLPSDLEVLAAHPAIRYLDVQHEGPQKLNHENTLHQRVNVIRRANSAGNGLRGTGVTVGVGDGGALGDHLDLACRSLSLANGTYSSFGAHGDHVAGIIGGGGLLNPRHEGMAPDANILAQKTSLITYYTEQYFQDHRMVLTNNSYGTSFQCLTNGRYNYTSLNLDWQQRTFPKVLHVFAAGNSGRKTCDGYPDGYGTVLRYYQAAKNVLTVGSVAENREIWAGSSRGPVNDGRLKPELCGIGTGVMSTGRENNYWRASGTSMSAPSVTGTLALMVERYRDLNQDQDPDGALIKAIACNSAEDLGKPGPDFIYGFGLINGRKAIETIDNKRYLIDSLGHLNTNTHNVQIPSGVNRLKVMLYWHDVEGDASGMTKALVNDLDIEVVNTDGSTVLPWILSTDKARVDEIATRGRDTLNNIEQVTIDQPAAGSYTIRIKGSDVPVGRQKYYVVFEYDRPELALTFPLGEEQLVPGTTELIQWDVEEENTHLFRVEYASDSGADWEIVADDLPADTRYIQWDVPTRYTARGRIRVSKIGGSQTVNALPFCVIQPPEALTAEPFCRGSIRLSWDSLSYAKEYNVIIVDRCGPRIIGQTTSTEFVVEDDMIVGERYWFSIQAKTIDNVYSQRTEAIAAVPETDLICPYAVVPYLENFQLDNDRGRHGTKLALPEQVAVHTMIRNFGQEAIDTFFMEYSVDGGTPVGQQVVQTIAPGDSLFFEFDQAADLSAVGDHRIEAWMSVNYDGEIITDTLRDPVMARQIPNTRVKYPYKAELASATLRTYDKDYIGLENLENWDFFTNGHGQLIVNATEFRLRPGIDAIIENTTNQLVLNLHLPRHNNIDQDHQFLRFTYRPQSSGYLPDGSTPDSLWIRPNEDADWQLLSLLDTEEEEERSYQLDLTQVAQQSGFKYSSTTQIRWSHTGNWGYDISEVSLIKTHPFKVIVKDFSVDSTKGSVVLRWKIGKFHNTERFTIETADLRQQPGRPDFEVIAELDPDGDTDAGQITFEYLDTGVEQSDHRLYRIVQYHADGSKSISPIREWVGAQAGITAEVFPNPFADRLSVSIRSQPTDQVSLQLFDSNGRLLMAESQLEGGNSQIDLEIDRTLPAGMYILKITNGKDQIVKRLIRQR